MDEKFLASSDKMDGVGRACCFVTGFLSMFHLVFFAAGSAMAVAMLVGLRRSQPLKAVDGLRFHALGMFVGLMLAFVPR